MSGKDNPIMCLDDFDIYKANLEFCFCLRKVENNESFFFLRCIDILLCVLARII